MKTMIKMLMTVLITAIVIPGKTQTNTWSLHDTILPGRRFCTSSELDGKIYVIGGQFLWDVGPHFLAYDPVTHTVDNSVADLPVALLTNAASSVVDGKIYVIGGRDGAGEFYNTVYEYDPATNDWTSKAEMPTPREGLNTAVVDDKIYAIGGRNFHSPPSYKQTVEMYDPATNSWMTKASMLTARSDLAVEELEGKIYAMGGRSATGSVATVEVYDPEADTWTQLGDMPQVRWLHGSEVINGQIYVFGSFGPTWRFDPVTDAWLDIEVDMPKSIAGFASSVVDNCIYTIGGMNSATIPIGDVYRFCPILTSTNNPEKITAPGLLFQNYPNPFDSYTMIKYELRKPGKISIKIFDLVGKEVGTLFEGAQLAGEHEIIWNAKGMQRGAYFYQLQTETSIETKKCVFQN